jgi:chromosome segregation ATPase
MNTTLKQLKSDVDRLRARADVADSRAMETKQLLIDLKTDVGSLKTFVANDTQVSREEVERLYSLAKAHTKDILRVDENIADIKADVSVLKTDVSDLKADVTEVKADVSVLKTDVSDLKADVTEVKADVSALTLDVGGISSRMGAYGYAVTRTMSGVDLLKSEFAGMKKEVSGLKQHAAHVDERMDRMDRNIGAIMRHLGVDEAGES